MVKHLGFFDVVKSVWSSNVNATNSATRFVAKLKLLRAALKKWSKGLSNLNILIQNCNEVLATLDDLEEQRPLFTLEFNFRKIIKDHILTGRKDTPSDGPNSEMKTLVFSTLLQLKGIG